MTNTRPETLFLHDTLASGYYLKDSREFTIGHFASVELAQQWCEQNGYRMHYTVKPSFGKGRR